MIQMNSKNFFEVAKKQASQNFIVNLEIDGAQEKTKLAIVQDIQRDPLTGQLIHVDFRAVNENDTIHARIPIKLTGEPAGVKAGGLLEQVLREIDVSCRPSDLPESIESDVSALNIGDSLKVKDLELPADVLIKMDGEVIVGLVVQTRAAASEGGGGAAEGAEGEEAAAEGEGGEEASAE